MQQLSEGLQLLYGAHCQGVRQASANRGTSTLPKLRQRLQTGTQQNLKQAQQLEKVSKAAGLRPDARHDDAVHPALTTLAPMGVVAAVGATLAGSRAGRSGKPQGQ